MPRSHASVKIINQNENDWFLMTNEKVVTSTSISHLEPIDGHCRRFTRFKSSMQMMACLSYRCVAEAVAEATISCTVVLNVMVTHLGAATIEPTLF